MRKKIFIYGFIACAIAVILTGIIAFFVMQSSIIEEAKLNARSIANMVINDFEGNTDDSYYETKAKLFGKSEEDELPYRITVIGNDGVVLGDSDADISTMDNHADRPEIIQAKLQGFGSERRYSNTLQINMLYVAVAQEKADVIVRVALPLTELKRMSYNLLLGCLLSVLAGAIVSLITSLIISKNLAKPISELTQVANELAKGNMDKRVSLKTNTEIDVLAEDLNEMADSLKGLLGKLKHKNQEFDSVLSSMGDGLIAIDTDGKILYLNPIATKIFVVNENLEEKNVYITDIVYQKPILETIDKCLSKKTTQILEQKIGWQNIFDYKLTISPMFYKQELAGVIILLSDITHMLELEKLRSDFVANVSHELRTPLTSIKGYSEALRDGGLKDEANAKRFLEIIEIESDRLNILINDLMELSKIENKSKDINISKHNLSKIVSETVDVLKRKAEQKKLSIEVEVEDDINVIANKDRIKQLLLNLIDNGIKYNKESGSLYISAFEKDNMINIIVKDTGEGIARDDIPRLFERFYRVEKSRSKELGGTGLGLSIVKHISELYGGSVTAISEKGVGSEFIVKMPITAS